ncbi:delta-aminolevulinic acid dehydratase (porphobilinogen synthase) [Candidatus Hydrogenisulfobacillus filiaventi]|uniref:Delta-aminolevulinic acid dehydratase n=1 Tax=Candidatus Hydrogenisulfobacillus filiaventi TaxID=2707344 RepID=A0A6F8ZFX1_9FIRM|nr:delta-aminolevulinic acid dehydratase (porphobilinogen synthase) [Candidatus Hydrogenisulfobacillus filiaventi]
MFPVERPRRLRQTEALRAMVRETHLAVDQLIYPLFVRPGQGVKHPVTSMPGVYQWSPDTLVEEVGRAREVGVNRFLLFGVPSHKDAVGSEAYDENGIVQVALRTLKRAYPDAVLIADLCLCEYTDHGHCGLIDPESQEVLNDPTLDLLARTAVVQAQAGADIVAPSDMMDGRVGAIRRALDGAGLNHTPILSYAVKYASAFYGPFREAAENAPQFGDRRSYQMDPANRREAAREAGLDVAEGADLLLVKPALPYLDVLADVAAASPVPVGAYQVSGEYAMIKAASLNGWLDEERTMMESLTAIRRAGAAFIVTYFAPEVGRRLRLG